MQDEAYLDAVGRLMDEAADLPDGLARTALVEEAVRTADQAQDLDLQFDLRLHLAQTAFNSGQLEKTIVAVAWCFGVQDQHPERFEYDELLDVCTFAMNSLSSLPKFPREQIEEVMDNIEQRYCEAGLSLRAVHRARCFNAMWMGDWTLADQSFQKMKTSPIDFTWEGDSWSRLFECDYRIQRGDLAKAHDLAKPILKASHDSHGSYVWLSSFMLVPLLKLDQAAEAERAQRRSGPLTVQNPYYAECVGHNILYLLAVDQVSEAVGLVQRCLKWASESPLLRESFELALAAWACVRRLRREGEQQWPGPLPVVLDGCEDRRLEDLERWLESFVTASAERFDARNQNDHFAQMIQSRLAAVEDLRGV